MTKGGKIALGVVSVLAVAGVGYLVYYVLTKDKDTEGLGEGDGYVDDGSSSEVAVPIVPICERENKFPMGKGSKGKYVKEFQTSLNLANMIIYNSKAGNINADCDWGDKTEALYRKLRGISSIRAAVIKARRYRTHMMLWQIALVKKAKEKNLI